MRIANTTIARNYTTNINNNLAKLNSSSEKVYTGRRYSTMAENTSLGVRAMTVRRNLSRISGYMDNTKDAQNKFDTAEKAVGQIGTLATDIYARFNYALNDTNGKEERDIIANEFEKLQAEILSLANGQYSDRYMFGGTNSHSRPFTVNDAGELMYNGERVKDIANDGSGKYDELLNDAAFVDIGLGLTMEGNSNDVIPNSAFKNTLIGIDFMGMGDSNLYDTITELINALRDPNFDLDSKGGALLTKIQDAGNHVNLARTKMGADAQYLEFTVTRLETEEFNLSERQQTLEIADPYESIMDYEMQTYVYNAALAMGAKLLQPTIFSFIS